MPAYTTVNWGASHMPTFSSTVDVEGEKFCGHVGKSKKQAELSAAKAAYTAFEERKSFMFIALSSLFISKTGSRADLSSSAYLIFQSLLCCTLLQNVSVYPMRVMCMLDCL